MRKVILLVILAFSHNLYSQGTQVKVKVFDVDGTEYENNSKNNIQKDDLNYFKLNPYLLFRGAFTLGYERILHSKHGIEINGGFTYRDFIFEGFDGLESEGENVNVKIGYIIDIAYKFYPKHYGNFDGPYLSPGFLIRQYNTESEVSYNYSDLKWVDTGYSMKETYLKFGYVYESFWLDEVIIDAYFGFGLRSYKRNDYEIEYVSNSNDELNTFITEKTVPAIYLGAKIGFVF